MTLRAAIAACDSKSTSELQEVFEQHETLVDLIPNLAKFSEDPKLEIAATWLIKRAVDKGHRPDSETEARILRLLPVAHTWQARLHVLQCIPKLTISKAVQTDIARTLYRLSKDRNNFIRAWAYSGLFYLSEQHRQHRARVDSILHRARQSESPAVKARLRNLPSRDH